MNNEAGSVFDFQLRPGAAPIPGSTLEKQSSASLQSAQHDTATASSVRFCFQSVEIKNSRINVRFIQRIQET